MFLKTVHQKLYVLAQYLFNMWFLLFLLICAGITTLHCLHNTTEVVHVTTSCGVFTFRSHSLNVAAFGGAMWKHEHMFMQKVLSCHLTCQEKMEHNRPPPSSFLLLSASQSGSSNGVIGKMEPSHCSAQDKVSMPKLIRLRSAHTGCHPHTITGVISLSENEKLLHVHN